jgi:hypothetical protein
MGLGLVACGGENGARGVAGQLRGDGDMDGEAETVEQHRKVDEDDDADNSGSGQYDFDDGNILFYGHPASPLERRAIVAVVTGYHTAAARADGAVTCAMMSAALARTTPRQYGQGSGSLALRGRSCPVVASELFARLQEQLTSENDALKAGVARVEGDEALLVLNVNEGVWPRHYVRLRRERGKWKVDMLLDSELP